MAINWVVFGMSLGALFFISMLYAVFIRWTSRKQVEGQTAWAVVVGVAFTLVTMVPTFGIQIVSLIFVFFAVSGVPMIVEYVARIHAEKRRDIESAKELAKDLMQ